MESERQAEASAASAASASPSGAEASGPGRRRDQVAVRSEATGASIGGDHVGQDEAAREDGSSEAVGDGSAPDPQTYDVIGREATAPETAEKRGLTLDDIEGHALRAIRYHEARARFLDLWRRILDFLVVMLGAGAVTTATGDHTVAGTIVGVLLAGIGALQLVAGFGEKAGEHASLKRRFCGVLADITEARGEPEISAKRLAKITRKWSGIWSDEPPTLHVLEAIAWNAARRAREHDLDDSTLIEISFWEGLTRNLSSWEGFEPLTRAERAARASKRDGGLAWWQRRL